MAKWVLSKIGADYQAIADRFGISPILARIIRGRGVVSEEQYDMYLNGNLDNLHDARLMTDLVKACSLIQQYIDENKKIRIIGDYDIDGVCATYILLQGLKKCGASVDSAIPHRIKDGYGLNEQLVTEAHEAGCEVIVTCDNGIAAVDQIAYASSLGIHTIVTDHHEIQEVLPPAEAVVDPHREGDKYPFPGICGAVVAWKLIGVLLPMCGVPMDEADTLMEQLLEMAAIATVGDVMELKDENRVIVKEGLRRIPYTANIGLSALIRAVGLSDKKISAYHIGFVIGPCMNASGRLDSATRILDLLTCDDEREAAIMADELKAMNEARKSMTEQGVERAIEDIEASSLKNDKVLILYLPTVHESLAGIIAGRLRERYEKPTIVMTDAESDSDKAVIKGSGRSIESYDMFENLSRHTDLFLKFGGHKMAAGLSMDADNLDAFREIINDECTLTEDDLTTKVVIDLQLNPSEIDFSFIHELEKLEPFGNGNSKPVFVIGNLHLHRIDVRGKNKNLILLKTSDSEGRFVEFKMFGNGPAFVDEVTERYGNWTPGSVLMDIIFYPGINEFGGRTSVEFIVNNYRFK